MIYLVGVHHSIQHNGLLLGASQELRDQFSTFLTNQITTYRISLIAEELSKEVLQQHEATISVARSVATSLKVKHRFCDPDNLQRKELGIPIDEEIAQNLFKKSYCSCDDGEQAIIKKQKSLYWGIREHYWFLRIRDVLDQNILFICGFNHIDSFARLLVANGHKTEVIDEFWMKDIFGNG